MAVPKQRRPGQTGGGGRIGQTSNRGNSSNRGGRPHAGGGGGGGKSGDGCAVLAITTLGGALAILGGAGYGLYEAAKALT